jgi:hypothetical protein
MMGKETLIMFLGAWVAVQSFLGFPLLWDRIILAILGIGIVGLGILLRREGVARRGGRVRRSETFVENTPAADTFTTSEEPHDEHRA